MLVGGYRKGLHREKHVRVRKNLCGQDIVLNLVSWGTSRPKNAEPDLERNHCQVPSGLESFFLANGYALYLCSTAIYVLITNYYTYILFAYIHNNIFYALVPLPVPLSCLYRGLSRVILSRPIVLVRRCLLLDTGKEISSSLRRNIYSLFCLTLFLTLDKT